jgi:GNAT superfamily N-acetyltransferase
VHAITLLADDTYARDSWFWSGFGMLTVDAIRGNEPIGIPAPAGFTLRQANPDDAGILAELEAEHWQHYAAAPVFMNANWANSADEFTALLNDAKNSVWLALEKETPAAYLRFEPKGEGSAAILQSDEGMHCTGAFTRPAFRSRGLAAALLDLALDYARRHGTKRVTVDFEAVNPEASAFWMKYFKPVCYSLTRIPENAES